MIYIFLGNVLSIIFTFSKSLSLQQTRIIFYQVYSIIDLLLWASKKHDVKCNFIFLGLLFWSTRDINNSKDLLLTLFAKLNLSVRRRIWKAKKTFSNVLVICSQKYTSITFKSFTCPVCFIFFDSRETRALHEETILQCTSRIIRYRVYCIKKQSDIGLKFNPQKFDWYFLIRYEIK